MSRNLIEFAHQFYVHAVKATYTDNKRISSLNRREHGIASLTDGGDSEPFFGFEIDGCRHVRRAAGGRGMRTGGSRIGWLASAAFDKRIIGDKCNISV